MTALRQVGTAITVAAAALSVSALAMAPARAASVQYTYDALGRVTSATYSNGTSISYSYDGSGNRTVTVEYPSIPPTGNIWDRFNWGQANW